MAGRPRKHRSDADRQRAYRQRKQRESERVQQDLVKAGEIQELLAELRRICRKRSRDVDSPFAAEDSLETPEDVVRTLIDYLGSRDGPLQALSSRSQSRRSWKQTQLLRDLGCVGELPGTYTEAKRKITELLEQRRSTYRVTRQQTAELRKLGYTGEPPANWLKANKLIAALKEIVGKG